MELGDVRGKPEPGTEVMRIHGGLGRESNAGPHRDEGENEGVRQTWVSMARRRSRWNAGGGQRRGEGCSGVVHDGLLGHALRSGNRSDAISVMDTPAARARKAGVG